MTTLKPGEPRRKEILEEINRLSEAKGVKTRSDTEWKRARISESFL